MLINSKSKASWGKTCLLIAHHWSSQPFQMRCTSQLENAKRILRRKKKLIWWKSRKEQIYMCCSNTATRHQQWAFVRFFGHSCLNCPASAYHCLHSCLVACLPAGLQWMSTMWVYCPKLRFVARVVKHLKLGVKMLPICFTAADNLVSLFRGGSSSQESSYHPQ